MYVARLEGLRMNLDFYATWTLWEVIGGHGTQRVRMTLDWIVEYVVLELSTNVVDPPPFNACLLACAVRVLAKVPTCYAT